MQRHRNVEVERIIVAHAHNEEHGHQRVIGAERDLGACRAAFSSENEALQCDEQELQERHQIAGTGIGSVEMKTKQFINMSRDTITWTVCNALDNVLHEYDIGAAAGKHQQDRSRRLDVHRAIAATPLSKSD